MTSIHLRKNKGPEGSLIDIYLGFVGPQTKAEGMGSKEFKIGIKIHPQVCLFRTKKTPKHFLKNSKTTLKKSKIRLFRPPKLPEMNPQNGQNEQIFDLKSQLYGSFIILSSKKKT